MNKNPFTMASLLAFMTVLAAIAAIVLTSCKPEYIEIKETVLSAIPDDSRLQIVSKGELPNDSQSDPVYYILKDSISGKEFLYIKTYHSAVITTINHEH